MTAFIQSFLNYIEVKSTQIRDNYLLVDFSCKGPAKKFLTDNRFFVQYNVSIKEVPEQFLLIPFLSTVCPIAWANHTDMYIDVIDKAFLDSLEEIQSLLAALFPRIHFNGKTHARRIINSSIKPAENSMMLFSGGVDSITTYLRHKLENPVLVSVQGADMRLGDNERWQQFTKETAEFASANGSKYRNVRSNFYELVNHLTATTFHRDLYNEEWWVAIMHGLSFLGLCAPLTILDDVGKLYLATSATKDCNKPHLSDNPRIDKRIRWGGTICSHDGYEMSRQQKIYFIAEHARKHGFSSPIRSCGKRHLNPEQMKTGNCSSSACEKCSRTILGLELAGLDPNKYGFQITDGFFSAVKENLENHVWNFDEIDEFMWGDIQRHARNRGVLPHDEAEEFIDWLLRTKLEIVESTNLKQIVRRIAITASPMFRYFPDILCRINRAVYEHSGLQS